MLNNYNPQLSNHAIKRCAQRNLRQDEVQFIIRQATRVRRAGVIFCQLRRRDLPDDILPSHRYQRLIGSTVVLSACGKHILTAYRDDRAFRRDTRKTKYRN